jgi:biopolymer transport protein ExbD
MKPTVPILLATLLMVSCKTNEYTETTYFPDGSTTCRSVSESQMKEIKEWEADAYHQITISISQAGHIYAEEKKRVSESELVELLNIPTEKNKIVLIIADPETKHSRFVEVYGIVKDQGISNIHFQTKTT